MKYRNIKTGVEIDVPSELGGDWEAVKEENGRGKRKTSAVADNEEERDE